MTAFTQQGIEVIRTTESQRSTRLVDRLTRFSLAKYYTDELAKNDNVNTRICLGMVPNIQEDSVDEYSIARGVDRGKPSSVTLFELSDGFDLLTTNTARKSIFILMSNLFNRADEIGERALANSAHEKEDIIDLTRLTVGQYIDSLGQTKYICFAAAYQAIKESATQHGLVTENWDNLFGQIVKAQLISIEKLKNGEKYSVTEALQYKHDTIGTYAKLLGNIMYGDNDRKIDQFVKSMMKRQAADDLFDVSQDISSQQNPFVAMLQESKLLDEFIHFSTLSDYGPFKWLVQLMLTRPNKFALFGSTNIFALFAEQHPELYDRIKEIKAGYSI